MKRSLRFLLPVLLLLGLALFLFAGREPKLPALPRASAPGTVTVTSNGCCFWVEDVRVWLSGDGCAPAEISYNKTVLQDDVFSCQLPDYPGGALDLNVEFRCFYGDECPFSLPVLHAESAEALKRSGVLLFFEEQDDMYLNVISGDYRARYKMGGPADRWNLSVQDL